jgi:hypothetical protein
MEKVEYISANTHVGRNFMATLQSAISTNKSQAVYWTNKLLEAIEGERSRFFSSKSAIGQCQYHISNFKELTRASDRLLLVFNNINATMSDISALGTTIAQSVSQQRDLVLYGVDNRFNILYQLLDKRMTKRDEFLQCINSYNDIVLSLLDLKADRFYKNLWLETITDFEIIEQKKQNFQVNDKPTKSISYRQITNAKNEFVLKNDTSFILNYGFYTMVNTETVWYKVGEINPGQTLIIQGEKVFYKLMGWAKDKTCKVTITYDKTVKAGFGYKLVHDRKNNRFAITSL